MFPNRSSDLSSHESIVKKTLENLTGAAVGGTGAGVGPPATDNSYGCYRNTWSLVS